MLFNSLDFIGFLIIVIPLYFILPHKLRWVLLLLASYFFYMSWNYSYIVLILFTTSINYFMGILMGRSKTKKARKTYLIIGLVCSLGVLFGFKYLNFVIEIVNGALRIVRSNYSFENLNILLPVGISFFTLQTLSYTIDVYRGKKKVEKHFGIFALYVSFFPQLVAGPIERSEHLLPQFFEKHSFDPDRFRTGLYSMLAGFFMKMVIADRLAISVNAVYGAPDEFKGLPLVFATLAFAVQIYCDFAGYSLIAIGTAEILGFRLMKNFNSPYLAMSIKDFWDRWHISLTTWLRDYLYIPLGGNRKGVVRQYINIFLVFAISGLWHGASFAFIFWGMLHAVYQIIDRLLRPATDRLRYSPNKGIKYGYLSFSYIITMICVMFAWIFFRAGTLENSVVILKNMFSFSASQFTEASVLSNMDVQDKWVAVIACAYLFISEIFNARKSLISWIEKRPLFLRHAFIVIAILVIIVFGIYGENVVNEFIYFQF